jgi:hypothetical protein
VAALDARRKQRHTVTKISTAGRRARGDRPRRCGPSRPVELEMIGSVAHRYITALRPSNPNYCRGITVSTRAMCVRNSLMKLLRKVAVASLATSPSFVKTSGEYWM